MLEKLESSYLPKNPEPEVAQVIMVLYFYMSILIALWVL